MKAEIKQKWIDALRSGDYEQTKHYLRDDEGYCCLGVLCDLHSKATGTEWDGDLYLDSHKMLPPEVCLWAGLDPGEPLNRGTTVPIFDTNLANMNDIEKLSFDEIADVIDKNF